MIPLPIDAIARDIDIEATAGLGCWQLVPHDQDVARPAVFTIVKGRWDGPCESNS